MAKTKNQKRQARRSAESKTRRLGLEVLHGHPANNPRGPVATPRVEGPGVTLRCPRCKATTIGGRKQVGVNCLMTRGCHGHLIEIPTKETP